MTDQPRCADFALGSGHQSADFALGSGHQSAPQTAYAPRQPAPHQALSAGVTLPGVLEPVRVNFSHPATYHQARRDPRAQEACREPPCETWRDHHVATRPQSLIEEWTPYRPEEL